MTNLVGAVSIGFTISASVTNFSVRTIDGFVGSISIGVTILADKKSGRYNIALDSNYLCNFNYQFHLKFEIQTFLSKASRSNSGHRCKNTPSLLLFFNTLHHCCDTSNFCDRQNCNDDGVSSIRLSKRQHGNWL